MKSLGIVFLALIALGLCVAIVYLARLADTKSQEREVKAKQYIEQLRADTTTVGNFSYVPINVDGNPAAHRQEVLQALNSFAEKHPELEVVCWQIEKTQYVTNGAGAYVYGVWIQHRRR